MDNNFDLNVTKGTKGLLNGAFELDRVKGNIENHLNKTCRNINSNYLDENSCLLHIYKPIYKYFYCYVAMRFDQEGKIHIALYYDKCMLLS